MSYIACMRHSGRVLRPSGPAFPVGLLPDLWGFGASPDLDPVLPHPPHRRPERARPRAQGRARGWDPLGRIAELLGRLFA